MGRMLLLMGSSSGWSEAEYRAPEPPSHPRGCRCGCGRPGRGRHQAGVQDCPCGCARRDLDRERRLGMAVACLRCLLHTDDGPDWRLPLPVMVALQRARADAAKFKPRGLAKARKLATSGRTARSA